jgi:hypothetical protein
MDAATIRYLDAMETELRRSGCDLADIETRMNDLVASLIPFNRARANGRQSTATERSAQH